MTSSELKRFIHDGRPLVHVALLDLAGVASKLRASLPGLGCALVRPDGPRSQFEHDFITTPTRRYTLFVPRGRDLGYWYLSAFNAVDTGAAIIATNEREDLESHESFLRVVRGLGIRHLIVVFVGPEGQVDEERLTARELAVREQLFDFGFDGDDTPIIRWDDGAGPGRLLEVLEHRVPTPSWDLNAPFLMRCNSVSAAPGGRQGKVLSGLVVRGVLRPTDAIEVASWADWSAGPDIIPPGRSRVVRRVVFSRDRPELRAGDLATLHVRHPSVLLLRGTAVVAAAGSVRLARRLRVRVRGLPCERVYRCQEGRLQLQFPHTDVIARRCDALAAPWQLPDEDDGELEFELQPERGVIPELTRSFALRYRPWATTAENPIVGHGVVVEHLDLSPLS